MPFGQTHEVVLNIAGKALWAFFSDVRVLGSENIPETGPIILACTHHNMAVDAAVLSWAVPYNRRVHYWAKSSLFKNPIADKSKYRSSAIIEFGKPINVAQFESGFLSEEEGAARACAKALTKQIQSQMLSLTINAPDWETLYSAKMTRSLLWPRTRSLKIEDFVPVSQVLVDLFSAPNSSPYFESTRKALLAYHSLLEYAKLSHEALADLPLPRTLDPSVETPMPSRLSTLAILLKDTLATAIRFPFFVLPLIIHLPAYALARILARMVDEEEETQAQMKMVAGILALAIMSYPIMFLFLWAFLWLTPTGALVAAGFVWMLAIYHVSIIDDNYEHAKRFMAAWRVLIGVWGPKRWDLSLTAVEPWTKPRERPPNEWIQQTQKPAETVKLVPPPSPSPKKKKRPAS
ncbi:hypothetical protein FRC12_014918, partial [Ceratobasidium sp. 428]